MLSQCDSASTLSKACLSAPAASFTVIVLPFVRLPCRADHLVMAYGTVASLQRYVFLLACKCEVSGMCATMRKASSGR